MRNPHSGFPTLSSLSIATLPTANSPDGAVSLQAGDLPTGAVSCPSGDSSTGAVSLQASALTTGALSDAALPMESLHLDPFILSAHNVVAYLAARGLQPAPDAGPPKITPKDYKNFNLLVQWDDGMAYLVKQERPSLEGKQVDELSHEWRVQVWLDQVTDSHRSAAANVLRPYLSDLLDYHPQTGVLVARYHLDAIDVATRYDPLEDGSAYDHETDEALAIVRSLGQTIAHTHHSTWHDASVQQQLFGSTNPPPAPGLLGEIDHLGPWVFRDFNPDALDFFRICQRDTELLATIQALRCQWHSDCLIHRDLRFANILLHQASVTFPANLAANLAVNPAETPSGILAPIALAEGEFPSSQMQTGHHIRLIDWEKFTWGDAAYDLGTVLANYLKLWLDSLVVHREIDLPTALKLATVPLETLQPSLRVLCQGYHHQFPNITTASPGFWVRVFQFAGVLLIDRLLIRLEYFSPFSNGDLCTLQVGRSLIKQPTTALIQILGQPLETVLL
jgi:hypothetical protein